MTFFFLFLSDFSLPPNLALPETIKALPLTTRSEQRVWFVGLELYAFFPLSLMGIVVQFPHPPMLEFNKSLYK